MAAYAAAGGAAYSQCMIKSAWSCLRSAVISQLSLASVLLLVVALLAPAACFCCWRTRRFIKSDCDYLTEDSYDQHFNLSFYNGKCVWIVGASSGSAYDACTTFLCPSWLGLLQLVKTWLCSVPQLAPSWCFLLGARNSLRRCRIHAKSVNVLLEPQVHVCCL